MDRAKPFCSKTANITTGEKPIVVKKHNAEG